MTTYTFHPKTRKAGENASTASNHCCMNLDEFRRLRERFRRQNYLLFRSDESDGNVVYFVTTLGFCHLMTDVEVFKFADWLEAGQ